MTTLTWNGTDLPQELLDLAPGRYVVTGLDWAPDLTKDEEEGLRLALEQAVRGDLVSQDDVENEMRGRIAAIRARR